MKEREVAEKKREGERCKKGEMDGGRERDRD